MTGYNPGLDGLRAVGMLIMLAFHAEMPWAPGAFLALSQFFTLSGFLVTTVLLRSRQGARGVDLRQFWARRARRLLPASLVGLASIALFGLTVADASQREVLPDQITAAVLNVANWTFIRQGTSYVDQFASPSPVQHYWSLSVEEQFYVVLPLLIVAVGALSRSIRALGLSFAAGIGASTAWMALLHANGASVDRIYYGTDTRLAEMLLGGLMAIVLFRSPTWLSARRWRLLGWVGSACYATSLGLFVAMPLQDGPMWSGGIVLFAAGTCLVIAGILSGSGPLRALSVRPLAAIGRITYGLYVFHLPIFLWLTAERTGLSSWPLFAVRLVVTFAAALASYHLIEMPIRTGRYLSRGLWRFAVAPGAIVSLVLVATLVGGTSGVDQLATVRGSSREMPAAAPTVDDGVVDVLTFSSPGGDHIIEQLRAEGEREGTLALEEGGDLTCGDIVDRPPSTTCHRWADTWPELVESADPDVVLLFLDATTDPTLEALTDGRQGDAATASARQALGAAIDLLTINGAAVVWASSGLGFLAWEEAEKHPVHLAMTELLAEREDLRSAEPLPVPASPDDPAFLDVAVPRVREALQTYRRVARDPRTKVMVVGDSQARSLGYGLEQHYRDDPDVAVWNLATPGCGIVSDGRSRSMETGEMEPASDECSDPATSWPGAVDAYRPDLVFVLSSVRDIQDRQMSGWDQPRTFGDPLLDSVVLDSYENAVRIFTAHGATIVWMRAPCIEYTSFVGAGPPASTFDPVKLRHLNDVVVAALVDRHPDRVKSFPLDELLCPDGRFADEIDGISPVRPDGVHLSVDGSAWLADILAQEVIER